MEIDQTLKTLLCTATRDLHAISLFPSEVIAGLEWKGANDPVTTHDRRIERDFRAVLEPLGIAIVGEEYGGTAGSGLAVHIDPIDSTKSWVSGRHGAAVSAALYDGTRPIMGGVGDIRSGMVYFAGPQGLERIDVLSGRTAPLTGRSPLSKPIIAMNDEAAHLASHLKKNSYGITVASGFALNVGLVAAGSYDAFLAYSRPKGSGPATWDIAGGLALCTAAGVRVEHLDGRPYELGDEFNGIMVAWPEVMPRLRETIRGYDVAPSKRQPHARGDCSDIPFDDDDRSRWK